MAAAAIVHRAREQLLACPRLAAKQYRDIGESDLLHGSRGALHGGAAAHQAAESVVALLLFEAVMELAVLAYQLCLLKGAIDDEPQMVQIDRFREEIEGPALHGLHRGADVAVSREQEGLRVGQTITDLHQKLHPGGARHPQVEEDDVVYRFIEGPARGVAIGDDIDGALRVGQGITQPLTYIDLVVGNQDADGRAHADRVESEEDVGRTQAGRARVTEVPRPTRLVSCREPPCCCRMPWAMESPRPVPVSFVV